MGRRQDLNGLWNLESTEGIDGMLIDAGVGWLKRKAAAQVLAASKNPRRILQKSGGDECRIEVCRKGEWTMEPGDLFADGQKRDYKDGWSKGWWDDGGWLCIEINNQMGHSLSRYGLTDANTMEMPHFGNGGYSKRTWRLSRGL